MLGDRWGVSVEEVGRRYPCDEFVLAPVLQAWRGVTVHSTSAELWAWVRQIQLAPYSYGWIDNLGHSSPQQLRDMPDPAVGQHFTTAGGRRLGEILAVEPGNHLTGRIMGAVMSYVLVPTGAATRLLLKVVMADRQWRAPFVSLGDLVMARRQLLNLKQLAEESRSQRH